MIEPDHAPDPLYLLSLQIIASAHYMLSELFQLDEPPEEDGGESLRAGGSEDSYSDEDRVEDDEEVEEELTEDSDDNSSYSNCSCPQDDSKAVAVIRSVGELSVPEKYKSTHQIRVSASPPAPHRPRERERSVLNVTINTIFLFFFLNLCSQVVLSQFLKTRRRDADTSCVMS